MVDSERRHISINPVGLEESLSRLFVECLLALCNREVDGIRYPASPSLAAKTLREEVFAPRNDRYDDSFADFGPVGVIVRLLDHARVLEKTGDMRSLAHLANYSIMALMA